MKARFLVSLSATCILNLGCTLSDNLLRTSVVQPLQYCGYWDAKLEQRRFKRLARLELERARACAKAESDNYACPPFSIDQERGFEAGFVDYLMYGGRGTPPPMPPRQYWWTDCESRGSYSAMQDWFRGFEHGAAVAQASGYRNCVVVPLSDTLHLDTRPHYFGEVSQADYAEAIELPPGQWEGRNETDNDALEPAGRGPSSDLEEVPAPPPPGILPVPAVPEEPLPQAWKSSLGDDSRVEDSLGEAQLPIVELSRAFELSEATPWPRSNHGSPLATPPSEPDARTAGLPVPPPDATSANRSPAPMAAPALPSPSPPRSLEDRSALVGHAAAENEAISAESGLIEGHRSSAIRTPIDPLVAPSLSAPRNASPAIDPRDGEGQRMDGEGQGMIEDQTLQRAERVEASGGEDLPPTIHRSSSPKAEITSIETAVAVTTKHAASRDAEHLVSRRQSALGYALLLVAGGFLLVRRHKTSDETMVSADQPDRGGNSSSDARSIDCVASNEPKENRDAKGQIATRAQSTILSVFALAIVCLLSSGCAALTNPVLNGIPVRKLPDEFLAEPNRDNLQTVPLSLLRQKQPEEYLLAAGDVLGVYIAGVFPPTLADQPLTTPPIYFPSQIDPLGAGLPPTLGYPVPIRNDGTLSLPLVDPISVAGLTVEEANQRVQDVYSEKGILQPGRESVMLALMQPRQVRVLVFRQEVGGFSAGGRGDISANTVKQGTGHIIDLRAYENDVANALVNSGGLPGLDTYAGVYIFRGGQNHSELTRRLEAMPDGDSLEELSALGVKTDYIPVRWPTAEPLPFQADDVILHEGDVVLIEARNQDVFYTAGLLPAGQRILPRDYDLDVVEAVVQVSGTLINGAFGGNNFNGLLIQRGIGNPNPSALTVIRRTPDGGQIPISVDLNRALVDPRERILVQPNDVLILQETREEAVARYVSSIFNFNIFWQAFQRGDAAGSAGLTQIPLN